MKQQFAGAGALLALLGLSACEVADLRNGSGEALGRSGSELQGTELGYGGRDDTADLPTANMVVQLNDRFSLCSGAMISPLLVLTAAHCIIGDEKTNIGQGGAFGLKPPISVSAPRPELLDIVRHRAATSVTFLDHKTTRTELGYDLALVFLDEGPLQSNVDAVRPVVAADQERVLWNTLLEIRTQRPSFAIPAATVATVGDEATYTFQETVGVAGFGGLIPFSPSLHENRQVALFDALALVRRQAGGWREFYGSPNSPTGNVILVDGDSGGPLFRIRPGTNARDVFGIQSGNLAINTELEPNPNNVPVYNYWVDLTRPEIVQWIRDNARDKTRTPSWVSRHGVGDRWVGEVDYTGPCDQLRDSDCDHWYGWHDNCPSVYNPGQRDADDDGFGDACDNCVQVSNAGQENCNALSERTNHPTIPALGDACDPVPCPQSELAPSYVVKTCEPNPPGPFGAGQGLACQARVVRDQLRSTPLGSHGAGGAESVVANVETSPRFCQQRTSAPVFNCASRDAVKDSQVTAPEVGADPTRPWHRVRFGTASGTGPTATRFPPRGATLRWNYGSTDATNKWFYQQDYAFWLTNPADPLIPLPADRAACEQSGLLAGTCLNGVFWLHADTLEGQASHGDQLANFYADWQPDVVRLYCPVPSASVSTLATRAALPIAAPSAFALSSEIGEFLWASAGADRSFDIRPHPETQLVNSAHVGILGALQPSGDLIALSDDGSSPCRGRALDSASARILASRKWASAAEPNAFGRSLSSRIQAVALRPDGTGIDDIVSDSDGTLGVSSLTEDLSSLLNATAVDGPLPPPRDSFASVFSRTAGGVFVLGGVDAGGVAQRDVWFLPLGGSWNELALGTVQLGKVLAATYTFQDDQLWIADEVAAPAAKPGPTRARLVRVDPAGGGASVVFFVPRRRPGLTPFLSVDRDGSPLLALADHTRFALLRLRMTPNGIAVGRVRTEQGKLVRAPIVDAFGYSFVLMAADGTLRVKRRDVLRPVGCDDDDDDEDEKLPKRADARVCDVRLVEKLF